MSSTIKRKYDRIKIVESDSPALVALDKDVRCQHCKERYYLTENKGDMNNLFCTQCGGLTPIRSIKHGRGIVAPSLQQATELIQSKQNLTRKPKGVNRKPNPLEEALSRKGRTVIVSDYYEPGG